MKLWLKISLLCGAVLLVIIGTCSTLLLLTAKDKIISLAVQNTKAEQSDLQESFRQMATLYGRDDMGPIERQSLVKFCFHSFADGNAALLSGKETIESGLAIDPQALLPLEGSADQAYCMRNVNGADLLAVGSEVTVLSQKYSVYVVRDVTDVYDSITQLILQFCAISAACITMGILLVIILVRFAAKPLKELGRSVKRIARGEYAERAGVRSRDEVGELAADFNSMAGAVQSHVEQLKDVAQRQQLFIGGLTHEFKTPLTSVIGHAETLLYTKMPEDVIEKSLLTIHEQCRWLERLTQKLLRLITLQENIQLQEEPVLPLLETVQDSAAEACQKRGVSLEISCAVKTLPMDRDLMLSLLVNLAENASKASAAGQIVSIKAFDRTIEVCDQGIGVPKEELSHITEPFYMVDRSRNKKLGGVGLGLALAKRIAEAHGAELILVSEPGKGTTARVNFPR